MSVLSVKNKEMKEAHSFVDGLKVFHTKGALVVPVRLNKRMKEILLIMIEEDKSNTAIKFEHDVDDWLLGKFLSAMNWLENKLKGKSDFKTRFNAIIAYELYSWIVDKKYHHLSGEKDFSLAVQWVTNQWNSRYAQSSLMGASEKASKILKRKLKIK